MLSIKQDCMGIATNSYFSIILSIKQDCIGMATNSQTSKCKVLHENGSIRLSITVCVHSSHLPLSLFCTQYDNVRP